MRFEIVVLMALAYLYLGADPIAASTPDNRTPLVARVTGY